MPKISVIIPVYRNGAQARQALDALLACRLPIDISMEVLTIDDASDDGVEVLLSAVGAKHGGIQVQLLRNPANMGRAATRNIGARVATGQFLLFIDADCVPTTREFLANHLAAMQSADVSIGTVIGDSRGFWHDYQNAASERRATRMHDYLPLRLTAANVMLRRQVFFEVGCFDEHYRGYGFEDRALAMMLQQRGARFTLSEQAQVRHEDRLSLETVCSKLRSAARNGVRFGETFPEAYRRLGYAAIDVQLHPCMRVPSALLEPMRALLIRWLSPRLDASSLPLAWRIRMVRWLCAASYLRGSVEAACRKKAA